MEKIKSKLRKVGKASNVWQCATTPIEVLLYVTNGVGCNCLNFYETSKPSNNRQLFGAWQRPMHSRAQQTKGQKRDRWP